MKNFCRAAFAAFMLAAVLGIVFAHPAAAQDKKTVTLKVVTINIRHNSDWPEERFPLLADEIVRLKPDLIGLQEIQIGAHQTQELVRLIKERAGDGLSYHYYEQLKTGGHIISGEGIGIFSRFPILKKKYRDLEQGRPVVVTRVQVQDGLVVDMYNTHLHNRGGDSVRLPQAKLITDFESKLNSGNITFLTGDMNSKEDSETIAHFLEYGFVDTYRLVHGDETDTIGNTSPVVMTLTNEPQDFRNRIDFVFMKLPEEWRSRVRVKDSVVCFKDPDERGLYPSDHLGVMTTFEIDVE